MALTASRLRQDIYRILDRILQTGEPVEIERGGRRLKIVPVDSPPRSKLENLKPHPDVLKTDPEEIVHLDWSDTWKP